MGLRAMTAAFVLAFLLATVATGVATYVITHATIVRLVDRRIENVSDAVAGDDPAIAAPALLHRISQFSHRRDTGDIAFILTTATGARLGGNVALGRPLPDGYSSIHAADAVRGLTAGRAFVRPVGSNLRLVTIAETEPFEEYGAAWVRILLAGFGSIVATVIAGVAGCGLLVARRIAATCETAEAIADGDFHHRVPLRGHGDAFDRQAATLNRMLDRITVLMDGLRHVSADVAHDLRAPLATLRGRLALTAQRDEPGKSAELHDDLEAAIAQCDRILALFAAILRIGDIEGGDARAGFVPLDLATLIADTGATMAAVAEDGGRRLLVAGLPAAVVVGDRRLLMQAMLNLVENALHHTPPGVTIRMALAVDGNRAAFTVADDGPGIAMADHATALRRFGRLDPSGHRAGHGLGLPMVAAIARLHRGTLTLGDARPGLAATIDLPLAGCPPTA